VSHRGAARGATMITIQAALSGALLGGLYAL